MIVYHVSKTLEGARSIFSEQRIRANGRNVSDGRRFAHVSMKQFSQGAYQLDVIGEDSNEGWIFTLVIPDDTELMLDPGDEEGLYGDWKVCCDDILILAISEIVYIADVREWDGECNDCVEVVVYDLNIEPRPRVKDENGLRARRLGMGKMPELLARLVDALCDHDERVMCRPDGPLGVDVLNEPNWYVDITFADAFVAQIYFSPSSSPAQPFGVNYDMGHHRHIFARGADEWFSTGLEAKSFILTKFAA